MSKVGVVEIDLVQLIYRIISAKYQNAHQLLASEEIKQ
jgi:hypothetical protein